MFSKAGILLFELDEKLARSKLSIPGGEFPASMLVCMQPLVSARLFHKVIIQLQKQQGKKIKKKEKKIQKKKPPRKLVGCGSRAEGKPSAGIFRAFFHEFCMCLFQTWDCVSPDQECKTVVKFTRVVY